MPRNNNGGGGGPGGGGGGGRAPRSSFAIGAAAATTAAALLVALGLAARAGGGGDGPVPTTNKSLRQQLLSGSVAYNKNTLCKHDYQVPNWDGRLIRACDAALCNAALPDQQPPSSPEEEERRWTAAQEKAYHAAGDQQIEGWLLPQQVAYVESFSAYQHELGVYGTVAEIGVHHGKFFAPLAGYSAASERALALDLFETLQGENIDLAGSGSQLRVVKTLTDITKIPRDQYTLMPGNSLRLSARNFSAVGAPAFRMFSVDGGHSLETVLHDFNVAACGLRQGGIIILDDWLNGPWIGATEAIVFIANAYADLVPFMHGFNKIWFTTRSHAQRYRAHADKHFSCLQFHPSRAALGGFEMCLTTK